MRSISPTLRFISCQQEGQNRRGGGRGGGEMKRGERRVRTFVGWPKFRVQRTLEHRVDAFSCPEFFWMRRRCKVPWCGFVPIIVRRGHFLPFLCGPVQMSTRTWNLCQWTRVSLTGVQLFSSISNKLGSIFHSWNVSIRTNFTFFSTGATASLQYQGQPSLSTWLSEP